MSGDRYLGDGPTYQREILSQTLISPFGGDIFRGLQMWGQKRTSGGPFLASQTDFYRTCVVSILTRDIDIANLTVRPSIRPSVRP